MLVDTFIFVFRDSPAPPRLRTVSCLKCVDAQPESVHLSSNISLELVAELLSPITPNDHVFSSASLGFGCASNLHLRHRKKPRGEWDRDVDVEGTTKEFSSDMLHYITRDASDNRNLINMIAGTLRADTARITASNEEIQGQTRQHSRPNTRLVLKKCYNEVSMKKYEFA